MTASGRLARVDRALKKASAYDLAEVLDHVLSAQYGVSEVELYLIDLRLMGLEPVLEPDDPGLSLVGTAAGQAFTEQRAVEETRPKSTVWWLPMSVRGDRTGVLRMAWTYPPEEEICGELATIAETVAHALTVADIATDRYARVRCRRRLTLAAEMQWQLLPVRAVDGETVRLAGQLEPAYAVRGDNFDWTQDGQYLTLAVTNGMGEGVVAAILTTLVITALRNARRTGASLEDQAMLADQALWAHHAGDEYVSTLLMRVNLETGEVCAVDAGSPRLWRVRDIEATPIELEQQLPLGMFDDTHYSVQHFTLEPGDRLFLLSDGIYDAVAQERRYSEVGLRRILRASRLLPPAEAVRALLSDLRVFLEDHELDDDAVAVCLDWLGPSASTYDARPVTVDE